MADGDVDVVGLVIDLGEREQRGDRPALDELEPLPVQTPLDVLGVAEVALDPPAQRHQAQDL